MATLTWHACKHKVHKLHQNSTQLWASLFQICACTNIETAAA